MSTRHRSLLLALVVAFPACGDSAREASTGTGFHRQTTTLVGAGARIDEILLSANGSETSFHGAPGPGGPEQDALPIVAYRKLCDGDRRAFGLESPTVIISASGSGAPVRITFGARNFTGAGVYTAMADDPCVYLTPAAEVQRLGALVDENAAQRLYGPMGPPVSKLIDDQERAEGQPEDNPWVVQSEGGKTP